MKTFTKHLVASAVALTLSVGGASAATIAWSDASVPGANIAPTSSTPVVAVNVTGSIPGLRRSPFADLTRVYNSVGLDASATYEFSSLRSSLELVWGSVDTYNFIDFYNGATYLGTFSGTDTGAATGSNRPLNQLLATISGFGLFDSVVLTSVGQNAFEHSDVGAVPVPAAGFLLFGALGGLAALRRRRQAA